MCFLTCPHGTNYGRDILHRNFRLHFGKIYNRHEECVPKFDISVSHVLTECVNAWFPDNLVWIMTALPVMCWSKWSTDFTPHMEFMISLYIHCIQVYSLPSLSVLWICLRINVLFCLDEWLLRVSTRHITDIETRNILTRLRLDKNILNSCQGKYKKVNFDQRYCPFCPAETVDHLIATCPKYTQTREVYTSKLISLTASNHINDRKLIQITMNADPMSKNTEKHKILACISHYIKSSYTARLNHAKAENPSWVYMYEL